MILVFTQLDYSIYIYASFHLLISISALFECLFVHFQKLERLPTARLVNVVLGRENVETLTGFLPPQGFCKIPRRHPYSSRVYKVKGSKVLTVEIYSRYIYQIKSRFARTGRARNKWVMMTFYH